MRREVLDAIVDGRVDLQFRRWRKPTVKRGGTLRTAVGELRIGAVTIIDPGDISDADALRAGYPDCEALHAELFPRSPGGCGARPKPNCPTKRGQPRVSRRSGFSRRGPEGRPT